MAAAIHDNLARTRIAPDLYEVMAAPAAEVTTGAPPLVDVIIEFNSDFPGGVRAARDVLIYAYLNSQVVPPARHAAALTGLGTVSTASPALVPVPPPLRLATTAGAPFDFEADDQILIWKSLQTEAYLFAQLSASTIIAVADLIIRSPDGPATQHPIHKIWRDHVVQTLIYDSVRTHQGRRSAGGVQRRRARRGLGGRRYRGGLDASALSDAKDVAAAEWPSALRFHGTLHRPEGRGSRGADRHRWPRLPRGGDHRRRVLQGRLCRGQAGPGERR